jgi:hypothetical protein
LAAVPGAVGAAVGGAGVAAGGEAGGGGEVVWAWAKPRGIAVAKSSPANAELVRKPRLVMMRLRLPGPVGRIGETISPEIWKPLHLGNGSAFNLNKSSSFIGF